MNRIELIAGMLQEVGADPVSDRVLAQAAIVILGRLIPPQPEPEPEPVPVPDPEPTPKPKPEKKRKRKSFDTGKLRALRNACWNIAKIADEMGVSEQTIRNHMKKEGIA